MDAVLLGDVAIILGLSLVILILLKKLNLPSILAFLITGIITGPYGLSLISTVKAVESLAEFGVIFLLFIIGIEFSLKTLSSIKKTIFIGGAIQVGLTICACLAFGNLIGLKLENSIFLGFLFALSSTAIVLKILTERGEVSTPHGRAVVGILIFQDIIVVPMMLITPILSGQEGVILTSLGILLAKILLLFLVVIGAAQYLFPYIMYRVVDSGNREIFLLVIIMVLLGSAVLTHTVGLSMALGAFFAGLIISESDYSHQATSFILPFRDIFLSFFFVSIGMLLDVNFLWEHLLLILAFTLLTFVLKGLIASIATLVLGYSIAVIYTSGLALFQVGEFSFILSKIGLQYQLISDHHYQYFLAVSILTMGLTPFVMQYSKAIIPALRYTPVSPLLYGLEYITKSRKDRKVVTPLEELTDHLVIIGYGLNGKNVAKAARTAGISYIAAESDIRVYRHEKQLEPNLVLGDAEDDHVLQHLHVQNARVVVIAVANHTVSKNILTKVRRLTKTAEVIVRTRYIKDIDQLLRIGADEVIPEEFETAIEIFTRVLRKYLVPESEIEIFSAGIREKNYDLFRSEKSRIHKKFSGPWIPDMEISTLLVRQGNNRIVGKTIEEAALKENYGIRVLAIRRGNDFQTKITKNTRILQDDIVYIFGKPEEIIRLNKMLHV